jgi:subtilase family serine protease
VDVVVGGRRVPQLGANQSHSTSTPVTLKADIKPGNYYLLVVADAKHQLEERTRENNVRAVRITVLPAEEKKK